MTRICGPMNLLFSVNLAKPMFEATCSTTTTNVDAYPEWQDWMRHKQPRPLMIWGKHDSSFDISEPEAYRRDVPEAEVHVLDAGHFALDTAANAIATLIRNFLGTSR
jgi:pimeloyl-ACP methyl ester carboxylesterase